MLVLSRKVGESISIGRDEIRVTVLDVTPTRVRLGIEADKDISVNRLEVEERDAKGGSNDGHADL